MRIARMSLARHPAVLVGVVLVIAAIGSILTAPGEYPVTAVLLLPLGGAAIFGWRVTAILSALAVAGGTVLAVDAFDGAALVFRLLFLVAGAVTIVLIAGGREGRERALARTDELRAVEADLRASEERYRSVLDATTSIVVITDGEGKFAAPQASWEKYTGQPWEEHRAYGWLDSFHPEDRDMLLKVWQTDVPRDELYENRIRLWHAPTGSHRFVIVRGAAVMDGESLREWIGTVTDVHEHTLADRRRANMAELRSAVLGALHDGLVITDRNGRVIEVNSAFTRLVGFSRSECLSSTPPYPWQPDPATHPNEWHAIELLERRLIATGPPIEHEIPCRHRDGHLIPTLTSVAAVREQGRVQMLISSVKDITERKAAEDDLRAERDFREAIVASLQEGMFLLSRDGTVLEVNDAWTDITGYSREAVVGARAPYPWWPDEGPDREHSQLLLGEAVPDRSTRELEGRIIRADGQERLVVVNRQPVHDPRTGEFVAVVGTFRDITRRAEAEARLRIFAALGARLATYNDVASVARGSLEQLMPDLGADFGAVVESDPQTRSFSVVYQSGIPGDALRRWLRALYEGASPPDGREFTLNSRADIERQFPVLAQALPDVESIAMVPLERAQSTIGMLFLASRSPHELVTDNADILAGALPIVAQALERAHLFEVQHSIASTLQHAMLPDSPLDLNGMSIATRYQPAIADLEVGGDWFDVVPLSDGRVAIAVGDIVGRGLEAAAVMGQLRSALGALAHTTASASDAIRRLDRYSRGIAGAKATTVCYGIVDTHANTFCFTTAGHPPPLLIENDGTARFLEQAHGWPLGAIDDLDKARPEAVVPLPPDSTLLLYTDGLIERRGQRLEHGLEELARVGASHAALPVELLCDELLEALAPAPLSDDTALVAVRLESAGASVFTCRAPAEPEQLGVIRRRLTDWLTNQHVPDVVRDDVILAVGEACTNAVEHAYASSETKSVVVEAHRDNSEVVLSVRDYGTWRALTPDARRNRGLRLMAAVMDDVAVSTPTTGGTRVRMRRNFTRV